MLMILVLANADIGDWLIPGGAITAGIWLFYRLFLRSDRRERDAFIEVKEQRDHYRERAELAERLLADAINELTVYRAHFGTPDALETQSEQVDGSDEADEADPGAVD